MTIHYSFTGQTGYTDTYTICAYRLAAPTVEIVCQDQAGTGGLIEGDLTVPTYEPYVIKVYGCAGKQVGTSTVYDETFCSAPGSPVMSAITSTTATATWTAASPVPSGGYNWVLLKKVDGLYEPVQSGNTAILTRNLSGLSSGDYKFTVAGDCGVDGSSAVREVLFTIETVLLTGTVNGAKNGGSPAGSVQIRSTTNLNVYSVNIPVGEMLFPLTVPYDEYEIISFSFSSPCGLPSIFPALNSLFTIDAITSTKTITINCT